MNLYIIRHAIAVEAGTTYAEDHLRPLTEKGKGKMHKIASGLKKELKTEIQLILTSPYLRAVETAKILRKAFNLGKNELIITEHLSPMGHGDQLINLINETYAELDNIALVGHEPSLSILASILISGEPNLSLSLKKGSVCCLSVNTLQYGRCATLEWLSSPSQLAELGE